MTLIEKIKIFKWAVTRHDTSNCFFFWDIRSVELVLDITITVKSDSYFFSKERGVISFSIPFPNLHLGDKILIEYGKSEIGDPYWFLPF